MLYHKDLGFPKGFNSKVGTVNLQYTKHAELSAIQDRYGRINLPDNINTDAALCFELEVVEGKVTKLVYRVHYCNKRDLILVCKPQGNRFLILTVWFNLKSDLHSTLNKSKYVNLKEA